MSEAEIPNIPSDPAESTQPESGWTTVNFPNAIEVDSIPVAESNSAPAESEPSQVGLRIKDLEQQNRQLRSKVAALEIALGESHATLRAETKRLETQISTQQSEAEQRSMRETHLTQQQAAMIAKQRQALDASRQRLQDQETQLAEQLQTITATQTEVVQLNQTLEQAHQVQQKQQILIETLTTQLESSQTQVAQLERDCALTKQRYDEQIQQLRQSESAGRDLRSRLHRQQQYTLQFKAALEKCLDVSATQKIEESVDHALSEAECQAEPVGFVKAQPVQPWSTTLDSQPWIAEPSQSVWATAPDDASLFEEESEPLAVEASEPDVPEVFEINYTDLAQPEPITVHPPLSYTIARSTAEETPIVQNNIDLFVPTTNSVPEVEQSAIAAEPLSLEAESVPVEEPIEEIAANPFHLALPPANDPVIPSPSPFITLSVNDRIRPSEPVELPTAEGSPSPVVYPQRSQKKLESLAAVELPSFPRSGK